MVHPLPAPSPACYMAQGRQLSIVLTTDRILYLMRDILTRNGRV